MGFSKEHQFLAELGLGPRSPGCYIGGVWRGSGPVVSSTNPANNQVRVFSLRAPLKSNRSQMRNSIDDCVFHFVLVLKKYRF